jgi:hypothetical protein
MSERNDDDGFESVEYEIDTTPGPAAKDAPEPEIEEDEPEPEPEPRPAAKADDDDEGEVSEKVQKRISKLTWRLRETERIAEALAAENKRLAEQHKVVSEVAVGSISETLEAKRKDAETRYKQAYEAGDADGVLKAQKDLISIQSEEGQLSAIKAQAPHQQEAAPPQQRQQQRGPDPKAVEWAQQNTWFGQDAILTASAYAIDHELKTQGVDPQSDEYYQRLDARLRQEFPNKFAGAQDDGSARRTTTPRSPVAGGTRTPPGSGQTAGRRSVRLSPSQVEIAKKLGVPLELYAKEVAKMERA